MIIIALILSSSPLLFMLQIPLMPRYPVDSTSVEGISVLMMKKSIAPSNILICNVILKKKYESALARKPPVLTGSK